MNSVTISNLDENIKNILQQQAEKNGRSVEAEIKEILRIALTENQQHPINIVTMLEKRFAHLGEFEISEIQREAIRPIPNFES
ncbi:FitA-like ribbon-helix-helix domain-containing protein [Nostoc sp. CMAA1605]|uniref:FitA-like ribbon-helix-helix domain-containing protein n=1 Tax=Nostoc sp. CMAA1605 TaxID=2055159 RepID=UPI001F40F676|nr:plasmid stability protein [Nostoc sp. CMAA1605]MCF4967819.1 plasmid stability protein [Nostoc sp. CMAA1605]